MSALSDIQALYTGVRGTWEKSRADIIAHAVLVIVVFWICGSTIPKVSVAPVDATQVVGNDWFKLAKDTGILYVCFLIPIVLVTVYAALLRAGGKLLVTIVMLIFPPSSRRNQNRLLTPWMLEPLALTLQKSDFELIELQAKASEFAMRYQAQKDQQWERFQDSMSRLTKNSQVYLGDFLLFLLCWIVIFRFLPQTPWVQANKTHYWPVIFVLSLLAWFAWFRVSRAIAVVPSMLLMFTSMMIRVDPDMRATLDVSEEKRDDIRRKLEQKLREAQQRTDSQPSLLEFIIHKLGLARKAGDVGHMKQHTGLPFPSLYEKGSDFAWEAASHSQYNSEWLAGYFSYLYYRLHKRLSGLAKGVWQLVRYIVTGAP